MYSFVRALSLCAFFGMDVELGCCGAVQPWGEHQSACVLEVLRLVRSLISWTHAQHAQTDARKKR